MKKMTCTNGGAMPRRIFFLNGPCIAGAPQCMHSSDWVVVGDDEWQSSKFIMPVRMERYRVAEAAVGLCDRSATMTSATLGVRIVFTSAQSFGWPNTAVHACSCSKWHLPNTAKMSPNMHIWCTSHRSERCHIRGASLDHIDYAEPCTKSLDKYLTLIIFAGSSDTLNNQYQSNAAHHTWSPQMIAYCSV